MFKRHKNIRTQTSMLTIRTSLRLDRALVHLQREVSKSLKEAHKSRALLSCKEVILPMVREVLNQSSTRKTSMGKTFKPAIM